MGTHVLDFLYFLSRAIFLRLLETGLNRAQLSYKPQSRVFGAGLLNIFFHEHPGDLAKARIKNLINFVHNWFGNTTVKGLRNSTGNAGQCIGVAAERNRCSDGVFKISRVNKCANSLRNCSLTGDIKFIRWADLVHVLVQIVLKVCLDEIF